MPQLPHWIGDTNRAATSLAVSADIESRMHQSAVARAVDHLDAALAVQPNNPVLHNSLGYAKAASGKLAEAADCYRRALELKPGYERARKNLAELSGFPHS